MPPHRALASALTLAFALLCAVPPSAAALAQDTTARPAPSTPPSQEATMTAHARGTFDVKMLPQSEDETEGSSLGRFTLEKQYRGDLEGSARGEMLTAMTEVKGSAAYVAVERFTGKLGGRTGSFALAHRGIMTRGAQQLAIEVVPDSGSGELAGIAGTLGIAIAADGTHSYDLEYTLPPAGSPP